MRDITRTLFATVLLWTMIISPGIAGEPVPTARKALPPSIGTFHVDGQPKVSYVTLGGSHDGTVTSIVSREGTCYGVDPDGYRAAYPCGSGADVYSTPVHYWDVLNVVTIVQPDAISRFGPLDEQVDIHQVGEKILVSAQKTSKKVLIYVDSESLRTGFDIDGMNRGDYRRANFKTKVTVRFEDFEVARALSYGMSGPTVSGRHMNFRIGKFKDPS